MQQREKEARRANWRKAVEKFDSFSQVGMTSDGKPIRNIPAWGVSVREDSGYVCSPIAYYARRDTGYTWFAEP